MKLIFITGASAGIGLATAKLLVARGHEVWGTSRDIKRLPDLPRLHPISLDLRDRTSIAEIFTDALRQAGHFDVVINNAGSGHFGPAQSLSHDELTDFFQILVFAQIELTQLALKSMQGRSGMIINVSSLASFLPVPYMAAYNAAKAAMASYTMSLQLELDDSRIQVVDLQPADIHTGFNDAVLRSGSNDPRVEHTWKVVERNMSGAPKPELVGEHVLRLIKSANPPPRIIVGDIFQSKVAPVLYQLLPQRLRLWGLRKYYGI